MSKTRDMSTPGHESVIFTNWTDEDFAYPQDEHCRWDGKPYSFPKKSKTILPAYLAAHFSKHLATREINRMIEEGADAENALSNFELRTKMIDRCYADNISEEAVEKAENDLDAAKDDLMGLTVDKLKKKAKKEKVDISGLRKKEDIADAIIEQTNKDEEEFEGNED